MDYTGAVTMPSDVGGRVRAQLQLLAGPILAWTRAGQQELWTFLARVNCFPQGRVLAELISAGAVICPAGTVLRLPGLAEAGVCHWVSPPVPGRGLPPLSFVVTINDWTGMYVVNAEVAESISRELLQGGHADAVIVDDESTAGLRRYPCERLWQ